MWDFIIILALLFYITPSIAGKYIPSQLVWSACVNIVSWW